MSFQRTWMGSWCGLALLAAGCGSPAGMSGADMGRPSNSCDTTSRLKFAMNQLNVPLTSSYKSDVDGDGVTENRLSSLMSTLNAMGFDIQDALNTDVKSGKFLMMADMQGPSMMTGCTNIVVHQGTMPAMPPKFDGTDTFQMMQGETPSTLSGNVAGGALSTTGPKDQAPAAVSQMQLSVPMQENVRLPITLYGAQMAGTVSTAGVMSGEIHGVVRKKDLDAAVIPAAAMALTNKIHADPTTDRTKFFIQTFEDPTNATSMAKCMNTPAQCCAKNPATCTITTAELQGNPLIQNMLAPDVQMFSGDTWSPKPGGTQKDSISFGVGFAASKASF